MTSREVHQPNEEEHEDAGRNDDDAKENEDDPLNPHVHAVHIVVAAGVQVRVRRSGRQGTIQVQRPVACVHLTAREWDARLFAVVDARNQVRAVPVLRSPIVPLWIRVADSTACVSIVINTLNSTIYS